MLVIFSGLPGTGKTALARVLARALDAVYLRIDSIEHALSHAGQPVDGPEGYVVGYAVAEDNLRLGRRVVADSVNPLEVTRQAWREAAVRAGVVSVDVEVICSDSEVHRTRVETRQSEMDGFRLPTWEEVVGWSYETWTTERIVIDTAHRSVDECIDELVRMGGLAG